MDDEPVVASFCRVVLRGTGIAVDTAMSGLEAIALLKIIRYDLLVADVRMPLMDGMALYQVLCKEHQYLKQRTGFISGDMLDEATNVFLTQCGCPFLPKPFTPVEFIKLIDTLISKDCIALRPY